MGATSSLFEAVLGETTELSKTHELVHSTDNCGTLEPRWWVVDIDVRARILDTTGGAIPRPGPDEFAGPGFGSRAPLHIRIDAGLQDGRTGSKRSWLIDATATRSYLFASTIIMHLLGPRSLEPYDSGGGSSMQAERDAFVQVRAGLWPLDTRHQSGIPGPIVRGNNCSIRVRVPAGSTDVAVPIPSGARTLVIYDSSSSSASWTWQIGDGTNDRVGRIAVFDGQTVDPALVPNATHVAPAIGYAVDRDVLLVFGMDL